tara:strand:+ start:389 stop:817 length:429 start_codon:yes stop_codon:yes gene_type:complete
MIKFWSLLIATVVFLSGCTATYEIPLEPTKEVVEKCPTSIPMDEWVLDVAARNIHLPVKHTFLMGDQVMVFMAAFNASPPESNFDPDTIVIFISPTDPSAVLGFVKEGCMMSANSYPLGVVKSWISGKPLTIESPKKKENTI